MYIHIHKNFCKKKVLVGDNKPLFKLKIVVMEKEYH